MLDFKKAVMIMGGGVALIFSVALGYSVYVYNAGATASGQANVSVNPYVYLKGIHPGDGGLVYTDPTTGNSTTYWLKDQQTPIFTLKGQTTDSTGAIVSVTLNNDGLTNTAPDGSLYGSIGTTRQFNSVTVTHISNLITVNGTTISAQKLILPSFFIDERNGDKYYVTRYDPQPDTKKVDPVGLFYTKDFNKKTFVDAEGGPAITSLDFNSNSKLAYIGTRAFAYLHNLITADLSQCPNLRILDDWALCRCESLESIDFPAISTAAADAYKTAFNTSGNNGFQVPFRGLVHYDNYFDTIDTRAQRGMTVLPQSMFRDCNGVKNLVLSSNLTNLQVDSFAAYKDYLLSPYETPAHRRIFYEGSMDGLQTLLNASDKKWAENQYFWVGTDSDPFDHKIHCMTAEATGTNAGKYGVVTMSGSKNSNLSYAYSYEATQETGYPSTVTTNKLFYKAA